MLNSRASRQRSKRSPFQEPHPAFRGRTPALLAPVSRRVRWQRSFSVEVSEYRAARVSISSADLATPEIIGVCVNEPF
jgi:hypothetical protein